MIDKKKSNSFEEFELKLAEELLSSLPSVKELEKEDNNRELLIDLSQWKRAERRRFARQMEEAKIMNGWCSDGTTIRLLFKDYATKVKTEIAIRKLPMFEGKGKCFITA